MLTVAMVIDIGVVSGSPSPTLYKLLLVLFKASRTVLELFAICVCNGIFPSRAQFYPPLGSGPKILKWLREKHKKALC